MQSGPISQERYRWRHDSVLRDLAHILEHEERKKKHHQWKHRHHLHLFRNRMNHEDVNQQHKETGHSTAHTHTPLDIPGRPGKETVIPRHRPDVSQTRLCNPVNGYNLKRRTVSTLERDVPACIRNGESPVHRPTKCTKSMDGKFGCSQ